MKIPILLSAVLLAGGPAAADLLVHEPFGYPAGDLTGNAGGSGWTAAWTDSGNPVTAAAAGLTYADAVGNALHVSGGAANTADGGTATTISARETGGRDGELWISMLVQPQGTFSDFTGVSFYDQGLALANARFAIENAGGKDLRLTRRAPGSPNPPVYSPSFSTAVGATVFAVLHLVPDGGTGEVPLDRIDVFFDPRLDEEPFLAHASMEIDGLQFDRVRVAAANGRPLLVDELRIGETYADVAPFTAPADPDSDADGLTDSQEAVLGTDPNVDDSSFIAALRANPGWLSLHSPEEIDRMSIGRLALEPAGPSNFQYTFEILDRHGFTFDFVTRQIGSPPDRRFLRLNLDTP